ncbi:MAG: SDR family NAD(P)-dependent oxidoreductase, partial [bacterium]|nr:SDR family NAD(P)-dependent oxidoreductase [bacterium]
MTKVVVITGATSGLGKLLAVYYANQNCQVFAGYRNVTLKKDLAAISENIIPFRIDMSKKWTVQEAIKFINTNTDHVDTLINAAGCVVAGPMECINVDKIREQFEVNTFSHVEFTQG